jgi:hypothetical protein
MSDFWNNLWGAIWFFFWAFAIFAYLIALFNVVIDLFRDHKLGGWAKAIWILFLIAVPFITVLIYLIARGSGMAERGAKEMKQAQDANTQYIREVAGHSASDEIAKAKELHNAGTISDAEFESLKAKALS